MNMVDLSKYLLAVKSFYQEIILLIVPQEFVLKFKLIEDLEKKNYIHFITHFIQ